MYNLRSRQPFRSRDAGGISTFLQCGLGFLTKQDALSLRTTCQSCRSLVAERSYSTSFTVSITLGASVDSIQSTALSAFPNVTRIFLLENDDREGESSGICSRIEEVASRFKLLRQLWVESPLWADYACVIRAVEALSTLQTLMMWPEKRWQIDPPFPMGVRAQDHQVGLGIRTLHIGFDADAHDGTEFSAFAAVLPSLLQLNALSLEGNFNDAEITSLAEVLPRLSSLQVFVLQTTDSPIEGESDERASRALASSCVKLPLLTSLSLEGCFLGPSGAAVLAAGFLSLPHLVSLDLSSFDVGIREAGAIAIAANLGNLPFLQSLSAKGNGISPAGIVAIVEAAKRSPRLSEVELWRNPVGDEGIIALLGHHACYATFGDSIDCSGFELGADAASALAGVMIKLYSHSDSNHSPGELGCITSVIINYDSIDNSGLFALAHAFSVLDLSKLWWLDIDGTHEMNDAGVRAVCNALAMQPLPALGLLELVVDDGPSMLSALGRVLLRAPCLHSLSTGYAYPFHITHAMVGPLLAAAGLTLTSYNGVAW